MDLPTNIIVTGGLKNAWKFYILQSTKLYFGEDSLINLNDELPKYGKNIVLVYGSGSVCDYSKAVAVSVNCSEDPWAFKTLDSSRSSVLK